MTDQHYRQLNPGSLHSEISDGAESVGHRSHNQQLPNNALV